MLKINLKTFIYAVFTVVIMAVYSPSYATKIAYINSFYVMDNSNSWKNFKGKIKNHALEVQKIVIEREKKIEKIWQKIKTMRDEKGNVNEIDKMEKQFQKESIALQKYVERQKKQMDKEFLAGKNKIQDKIISIAKKIVKEEKIDILMNVGDFSFNSAVLYAKDELSLTEKVLNVLNKSNLKLNLNLDKGSIK
ncbi:MAG: OmpH family outer membrane protein [Alphaproteobacteria bacterium]